MNYNPNPPSDHYHDLADTNDSELAIHHTIGEGPTEALSLVIAKKHFYTKDVIDDTFYTKTDTDAPFQDYTPSILGTGWNPGNGVFAGRWRKNGPVVSMRAAFTLGSTLPTWGSATQAFTLPVPALSGSVYLAGSAQVMFLRTGALANAFLGVAFIYGSGVTFNYWSGASVASAQCAVVNSSTPWTWAAGDAIIVSAEYEPA